MTVIPTSLLTDFSEGGGAGHIGTGGYKGYDPNSNYCIEIWADERGRWQGDVISTFLAHQVVQDHGGGPSGRAFLRGFTGVISGRSLVMRLCLNDSLCLDHERRRLKLRIVSINSAGRLSLVELHQANVDSRNRDKQDAFAYIYKQAGSLQSSHAKLLTVSPAGEEHLYPR